MRFRFLALVCVFGFALSVPANSGDGQGSVLPSGEFIAYDVEMPPPVDAEISSPAQPPTGDKQESEDEDQPSHREEKKPDENAAVPPAETIVARNKVALTFDDGPTPFTLQLLELFKQHNVKVSFFMVGENIKRYPDIAKAVHEQGHEIGNHTMHHPMPSRITADNVRAEVEPTSELISAITGHRPTLFRTPYGSRLHAYYSEAERENMRVVFWTVDPYDWKMPPAEKMAEQILRDLKPNAIILMHDGGGPRANTVKAVSILLDEFKKRDYRVVPISDL